MTDICPAVRHEGDKEPPEVMPGASLCRACAGHLTGDLRRLPGLSADLELLVPSAAGGRGGNGDGLPFNEAAADCHSQIRHDVTYWSRHVTQLRGLDAPPVLLDGWAEHPVTVMCGWLAGQVTWCTFRDWAPDMAGAISADRSRAVALLDPWVTKRFEIPGPDGACLDCPGGRMWVTVYVYAADHRKSFIGCTECVARWEFGGAWLPFVRQVLRRRSLQETA